MVQHFSRMPLLVTGMAAIIAMTFNFTNIFRFQSNSLSALYVLEPFSEQAVSSSSDQPGSAATDQYQSLDLVESSRNTSSLVSIPVPVPVSKEPATPLRSRSRRVPSPSRSKNTTVTDGGSRSKKTTVTDVVAVATVTIRTPTAPIPDSLCGGCRLAIIKRKPFTTCGNIIQSIMSSKKNSSIPDLTLVQAAVKVGAKYEKCARCDPSACPLHEKLYWRFDQKAPIINFGRTHMLSSIPAANRIPASAIADLPSCKSCP
jgi:hypothetical protein